MKFKSQLEQYDDVMVEINKEQMRHSEECRRHIETMGRLHFKMSKIRAFLYDGALSERKSKA